MPEWINFKELRAKLSFEKILTAHQIPVRKKGIQHTGPCPLPGHGLNKGQTFSANLERGIFHCFGCKAKGNLIEFAALMAGVSPTDGPGLRRVAENLARDIGQAPLLLAARPVPEKRTATPVNGEILVNARLDFELKGLDPEHPFLRRLGLSFETIAFFGLGFCSRGFLKGRIAVPLHSADGELIGYAGILPEHSESEPEVLYPARRERNGRIFDFRQSLFLYNGFRIREQCDELLVVGSLPSVWWLWQNGHSSVVSVMAGQSSAKQAEMIAYLAKPHGRVLAIPDLDRGREEFASSVLLQVGQRRAVQWIKLGDDVSPIDLSPIQLQGCFGFAP